MAVGELHEHHGRRRLGVRLLLVGAIALLFLGAGKFADDREHAAYDPEYAHRFWRILIQADRVMKRFRGRFLGKSSPVHWWDRRALER